MTSDPTPSPLDALLAPGEKRFATTTGMQGRETPAVLATDRRIMQLHVTDRGKPEIVREAPAREVRSVDMKGGLIARRVVISMRNGEAWSLSVPRGVPFLREGAEEFVTTMQGLLRG